VLIALYGEVGPFISPYFARISFTLSQKSRPVNWCFNDKFHVGKLLDLKVLSWVSTHTHTYTEESILLMILRSLYDSFIASNECELRH
jgi:hypothetical protein